MKQSGCAEEVVLFIENGKGERQAFSSFIWPEKRCHKGPLMTFELDAGDVIAEHAELFKQLKISEHTDVIPLSVLIELLNDYGAQDATFRL